MSIQCTVYLKKEKKRKIMANPGNCGGEQDSEEIWGLEEKEGPASKDLLWMLRQGRRLVFKYSHFRAIFTISVMGLMPHFLI